MHAVGLKTRQKSPLFGVLCPKHLHRDCARNVLSG
jgi:hypothetical protein